LQKNGRCSILLSFLKPLIFGQIAQSVEQRTENPCVAGSIPVLATFLFQKIYTKESQEFGFRLEAPCRARTGGEALLKYILKYVF
jgi:hypothetical protein